MDFRDIINNYSNEYTLTRDEGGTLVDGKYVEGTAAEYLVNLAIFPLEAEEAQMYEGDKYTTEDIVIYAHSNIQAYDVDSEIDTTITIKKDDIITFDSSDYKIDKIKSYDVHGKFVRCVAKKVVVG